MAMSRMYVKLSRGYVNVRTQYGYMFHAYAEVWGSYAGATELRVFFGAPKGYKCDVIRTIRMCDAIFEFNSTYCSFDINPSDMHNLDNVVKDVVFYVERKVTCPMGIVVCSKRQGVMSVHTSEFASYRKAIEMHNDVIARCCYPSYVDDEILTFILPVDLCNEAADCMASDDEYDSYYFEGTIDDAPLLSTNLNRD